MPRTRTATAAAAAAAATTTTARCMQKQSLATAGGFCWRSIVFAHWVGTVRDAEFATAATKMIATQGKREFSKISPKEIMSENSTVTSAEKAEQAMGSGGAAETKAPATIVELESTKTKRGTRPANPVRKAGTGVTMAR